MTAFEENSKYYSPLTKLRERCSVELFWVFARTRKTGASCAARSAIIQAAVALASLVPGAPLCAQQTVRPEIDPGQVQRRIATPPAVEPPLPALQVPTPAAAPAIAPSRFVLAGVTIDGTSVFDAAALTPVYEEFLAREIGTEDVERILQRITTKYRDAGYFLTRAIALPQALEQGVLRVTVIEGYVRRVTFRGARPGDDQRLNRYFATALEDRPAQLAPVECALLLVDDLPGVHLRPVLVPVDERSGIYDLVLTVEYATFSGFASLDNLGSEALGPWQAQIGGGLNSLIRPFDRLQLSIFTTINRPSELLSTELLYDTPLGSAGTRSVLSVERTDLKPRGGLTPEDIEGTAMRYTARLSHPVIRTRPQSLWLSAGFDALNSTESQAGTALFDDRLRVLRATAIGTVNDGDNTNAATFEVSQGLGILDASRAGAGNLSRPNGRADFNKLTASLTREQVVSEHWGVEIALAGQKAAQRLLLPEQFPLGGQRFGRAYDPAEIVGDDALAGSVELRYGGSAESRLLRSYQFYGFSDYGSVWNMDVHDGTQHQTLASFGGGVRLGLPQNAAASLEIAKALTRRVAAADGKPVRVFIRLSAPF
jgi:hemolysin activation/secretion protein